MLINNRGTEWLCDRSYWDPGVVGDRLIESLGDIQTRDT